MINRQHEICKIFQTQQWKNNRNKATKLKKKKNECVKTKYC